MSNLIKSVSLIATIIILIATSSCTKDNDDNIVWNPDGGYPYVLPESMQPYQYAVYQEDGHLLFGYIQLIFESMEASEEKGYFILSSNAAEALLYCGFISETSSYYDPTIEIYPDSPTIDPDDDGGLCFEYIIVDSKGFGNANDAAQWGADQVEGKDGYKATINYNKKKKEYFVIIQKWED